MGNKKFFHDLLEISNDGTSSSTKIFFLKKAFRKEKKEKRKDICKKELPLLIHLFLYSFPYPSPTLQLGHVDMNSTSLC